MTPLKIALDWTFNANHLPIIIASNEGFYKEHGIDFTISTPDLDNYAVTPAKKVELKQADLALCPLESVLSYRTKSKPFPLTAIAALFKEDLSAVTCKPEIASRPSDLDGKSYASYNARYEDAIVRQMIKNDGGTGALKIVYPDKLGIWNTIENSLTDSTWIFTNWEALEAEEQKMNLNLFKMKDYDIPYSYSPVITANETEISKHPEVYRNFLSATRKGAEFGKDQPDQAVDILQSFTAEKDKLNYAKSVEITNAATSSAGDWGIMEPTNVSKFIQWLRDNHLEHSDVDPSELFTNHLLS
ncbi:MAG: ABC transporter substrate-binding protein [Nonlabens sp.]